jgi:hypothetical protein
MLDEHSHRSVSRGALIVEDSRHIATTMESSLEEVDMIIVGASASPGDAVRLANEHAPNGHSEHQTLG